MQWDSGAIRMKTHHIVGAIQVVYSDLLCRHYSQKRQCHLKINETSGLFTSISSPWGSWTWWEGEVPRSSSRPPSRGLCTGILTPPQSENGFAPEFQSALILDALQIHKYKYRVFFWPIPKTHFYVLVIKLNRFPKSLPFSTIVGNQFSLNPQK